MRALAPVTATTVEHVPDEAERLRASGGPQDRATYHCGCGVLFLAAVSTTVACPGCGAAQTW